MNAPHHSQTLWTQFSTALLAGSLLVTLGMAAAEQDDEKEALTKCIANGRQIILGIRLFAADHQGTYPDFHVPTATESNTVFKQLFVEGLLEDEGIFGCANSPFSPDGAIGQAPNFAFALAPGENHWAVTRGLNDSSPGSVPLVYENPVTDTWPPMWNADAAGKAEKGRCWKGGRIVVGLNDTSVEVFKLSSDKGPKVTISPEIDPFFKASEKYGANEFVVLDVAVKK
jgi:hypothetical protein